MSKIKQNWKEQAPAKRKKPPWKPDRVIQNIRLYQLVLLDKREREKDKIENKLTNK